MFAKALKVGIVQELKDRLLGAELPGPVGRPEFVHEALERNEIVDVHKPLITRNS